MMYYGPTLVWINFLKDPNYGWSFYANFPFTSQDEEKEKPIIDGQEGQLVKNISLIRSKQIWKSKPIMH